MDDVPVDQRECTYISLVKTDETTDDIDIVSLHWLQLSNYPDQENKFSDYFKHRYGSIEVFGPRNGIYCLHESTTFRGDVIALMNVSSREFKFVPKPAEQSIIWHTGSLTKEFVEIGFDPKTNDYKVVFLKDCIYPTRVRQAAVYRVSSNSWKKLNDPLLSHATVHRRSCITDTYVNGNVHWLAFEGDPSRKDGYILSFDMVGEVFAKIKLPDSRICEDEYDSVFAVGNESLSLIVYPMTPHYPMETSYTKCFDVWVMQEYGNDSSWTKQFTIGPIAFVERLLGFWRNGEFLLEDGWGYTSSYEPSTQKMEKLFFDECQLLDHTCIYSESLVSVTGNAQGDFEIVIEDLPSLQHNSRHEAAVLDYTDT